MPQKHSRPVDGGRAFWNTERLWELTRGLPVKTVAIDQIAEFDQNCWFGPSESPTCRAVAEHARKISAADLTFPIILSADGRLMDGGHRVCKAYLLGHDRIDAVQFTVDPTPDYFVAAGE